MRNEYFFGFILGTAVGVLIENILNLGYSFSILCALVGLVAFFVHEKGSRVVWSFFVSLSLLGCALGVIRVDVSQAGENAHTFDKFIGITTQLEGVVVSEPDVREVYTNIVLGSVEAEPAGSRLGREINSVLYKNDNIVLNEKPHILVRTPVYPELKYGDAVMVSGKVAIPKNFTNDNNGRIFDYRSYLAKDGIYYEMYFPKVVIIAHNKGSSVREKLFAFKAWLMKNISQMIPEPEASLGGGITLGVKQSLGDDLVKRFRETGLAHIVVLSGYNIAVVVSVIARVFSFSPFVFRLVATAISVVLFATMVGAESTVMRATLMALVVILARALGRDSDALRVLVFVGWVMILINPTILLHDVSFQLSFMATLSLCVLAPLLEKYFLWVKHAVVREILVTTIATQIFVAPILLYQMGNVSIIGVVANLFVLPFVPLAMLLVALVAFFAWVPLLASIIALAAQLLLSYILFIAMIGSKIPFSNIHIQSFGITLFIISYTIIFAACFSMAQKEKQNIKVPVQSE